MLQPHWGPLQRCPVTNRLCSRPPIVTTASQPQSCTTNPFRGSLTGSQVTNQLPRTTLQPLDLMAESEDIFLRAKHRTFSGLTEGSRLVSCFSQPRRLANLQAKALANALSNLAVTQVVVAVCRLTASQSKRSHFTAFVQLCFNNRASLVNYKLDG